MNHDHELDKEAIANQPKIATIQPTGLFQIAPIAEDEEEEEEDNNEDIDEDNDNDDNEGITKYLHRVVILGCSLFKLPIICNLSIR